VGYQVREVTVADEPFLWLMLYAAAHMEEAGQSPEDVNRQPELARYVEGWGREGDIGCIAVSQTMGEPVSAAWVRLFTRDGAGYGYVNDETPELVIGTVREHRGRRAGTQALRGLIARCQARYAGISLSVRADNPAVRLYERLGFRKVAGAESVNRVGTTSYIMLLSLK
jgi:ribosomal protein S18 acetylase RimI-like enzyme